MHQHIKFRRNPSYWWFNEFSRRFLSRSDFIPLSSQSWRATTYTSTLGRISMRVLDFRLYCFVSASTGCVDLPRVQTSVGQRSFAFHGPTVWNSLLSALCDSSLSLNTFKRRLKTHLFGQSWMPPGAIVAFCDSGAGYKCHDSLTYLQSASLDGV